MREKIKIAIDGREANILSRVGSNVYAFEIITALEQLLKNRKDIEVTVLLAKNKIADLPESRKNWTYKVFGPQKFWTQWALPIHLFKNKNIYDVFFTPGHYAPRLSPIPYISSVMDLAFLDYPEQFKKTDTLKLQKWTEYSVNNAKKVIAISNYTKTKIIKNYSKQPTDIVVAYPAVETKKLKITSQEKDKFFKKHKITQPYILFVGTLQPRKNLIRLIEAFEIFNRMKAARSLKKKNQVDRKKQKKVKLVLAGKIGWLTNDILKKIANSPLKSRIITTNFVSEKEKQILYKHAFASCLVGLHEGFGIPPLESLSFSTPAIVSNTTSLPEVIGNAGFLVDPLNPEEIANNMWKAFSMTAKQKISFRKKTKIQLKKFSWGKSAKKILLAIIEVANE